MFRFRLLFASILISALPSFAGVTYTTVSVTETGFGKSSLKQEMRMQAWVSGGNAKTQMLDGGGSPLPAGAYMLKRADNAAMLMVDPAAKQFSTWDMATMMEGVGKAMHQLMKIDDAKWEKVSDEDGPDIAGFPTRHYHYRFSYTIVMTVDHQEVRVPAEMNQEFWVTDKINEPGLQFARDYQVVSALAGVSSEIEQMLRAEMNEMKGFALKQQWSIQSSADGETNVLATNTTTVQDLKTIDVPESVFALPAEFKQVPQAPISEPRAPKVEALKE